MKLLRRRVNVLKLQSKIKHLSITTSDKGSCVVMIDSWVCHKKKSLLNDTTVQRKGKKIKSAKSIRRLRNIYHAIKILIKNKSEGKSLSRLTEYHPRKSRHNGLVKTYSPNIKMRSLISDINSSYDKLTKAFAKV